MLKILLSMVLLGGITVSENIAQKTKADLLAINGHIVTVNGGFELKESFAVKNGKFIGVGSNSDILDKFESEKIIDLKGKYVYPGFIDAHCHFYGYAGNLQWVNLTGTKSFDEIIERLLSVKIEKNNWILGRGWDQNDWDIKEFPSNEKLNKLFPNNPVLLTRIDGHAILANKTALDLAGINIKSKVPGGEFIVENGVITGILIDNAAEKLKRLIPHLSSEKIKELLLKAQNKCFAVGLTTVSDAGLDTNQIEIVSQLQNSNKLKMRMYAMINPSTENFEKYLYKGIFNSPYLNIRSIKLYADGALGSRGAKLIEPYSDDTEHNGLLITSPEFIKQVCKKAYKYNYQVNTHAIGDSAVRMILNIYGEFLQGKNDRRWRIEHSQVVNKDDFALFGKYSIVPSIQTTHATSDMYWAEDRLGAERVKTAYAYKQLMKQNGWIPNGSDFPVEDINPLFGFYAAFTRQDHSGYPKEGFQIENALTREEALKAMTIWAAKADFEENVKGSIEKGKYADFVILNEDLLTITPALIPNIKVQETYIGGEKVY